MKKKPIYQVFLHTQYGIGMQPTKANNQAEAKRKVKKRWPKRRIISANRAPKEYKPITEPI